MSDFTDKKYDLDKEDTLVVSASELEEKLRLAREAALCETVREDAPELPEMSEAEFFLTGRDPEFESIFREIRDEEKLDGDVRIAPEPVRQAPKQPAPPKKAAPQPSPEAQRAVAQKTAEARKRKKTRVLIICAATALILAVMLIIIVLIRNGGSAKEYESFFSKAQLYYYDGDYDSALEQLRSAMSVDKTDECLLLMADCYEAKSDLTNAIAILESSTTGSKVIKARISKLKDSEKDAASENTARIAGTEYEITKTELNLSKKGLRSGDLNELQKMTALRSLKLSDNAITSLDFLSPLTSLESLDLSKNDISDLSPLSSLTELYSLHLDSNNIKDYEPLYGLRKLASLTISGMEISEKTLNELKKALPGCVIYSEEAVKDIEDLELGGKSFKSDATALDLSGLGIGDISVLSKCTELETLNLSGNSVRNLTALLELPKLKYLDLSGNSISDIRPLMNLSALEYLNLDGNSVSSIAALAELGSLSELVLSGNPLKSFSSLESLTGLKKLNICNTGLTDTDLQYLCGLGRLSELAINDNDALTLSAVDGLKEKLPGCSISHSELKDVVILGDKKFDADSETVSASGLSLSDISAAAKLVNVKSLDLSNNRISDVSALEGLQSLEILDLENNRIKDISPLLGLTGLRELYISGNQLMPEQVQQLSEALPGCLVTAN